MRLRTRVGDWTATTSGALGLTALLVAAGLSSQSAADPDFPTIPAQPSDGEEGSNSPASQHDCAVIKSLFSHVDVVLSHQIQVTQEFPSKEEGGKAVNADLDVLNSALPFLVSAEASIQSPEQRAKVTAYKNDLGQLSPLIAERLKQDLTTPAPYAWAEKLSEANNRAGTDYSKIGASCLA